MIELATENLAGIECIHATPAGQRQARLPTILFYHGFTSSKEVYSYFAVALAQAGFRVVMPDADMHGVRYSGDTEARMTHFWDILKQNIDEVPLLEAALRERDLIADDRFAVAGASMDCARCDGALSTTAQRRLHDGLWLLHAAQSYAVPAAGGMHAGAKRDLCHTSCTAGALRSQPATG